MKKNKEPSNFTLGDLPSSLTPFDKIFNTRFLFVKQLFEANTGLVTESNIKNVFAGKFNITSDSARKILRDYRYMGLIGKRAEQIFITDFGQRYLNEKDNKDFMFSLLNEIHPPIQKEIINFQWLGFIHFLLHKKKMKWNDLIYLFFINKIEFLNNSFEDIFNKVLPYKKTKYIVNMDDVKTKNRLSHLKSLYRHYDSSFYTVSNDAINISLARPFQGKFRNNLIKETSGISMIKKIDDYKIIIASHIIDYKDCKGTDASFDHENGLFLTPDIDALFDKKIITFNKDGDIFCDASRVHTIKQFNLNKNDSLPKAYMTQKRIEFMLQRNEMYFKNVTLIKL